MEYIVSDLTKTDRTMKSLANKYFYSIVSAFLFFTAFYWYERIVPFNYLSALCLIVHILFSFIPYKLNYQSLKPLIPVYFVFLTIMLYPFVVIFWEMGRVTAFIWYLLIPFGMMLFFPFKTVIKWGIYIFLLICSVFLVAKIMPYKNYIYFKEEHIYIINIVTVFYGFFFISFILFYMNKLHIVNMISTEEKNRKIDVTRSREEKYAELYDNLVTYIEKEHPYCDPDFTIVQLAAALNTNIAYISRAIKYKRKINFTLFINLYRISKIKEMIEEDYHNKFTLKFIYTTAGFKHQSTFNKVFKQIEGITPSEYIEKMQKKQNR